MTPKKKKEQTPSRTAPSLILILVATLVVGIILGVGAKLAYDSLVGFQKSTPEKAQPAPPSQNHKEQEDLSKLPTNFPPDFPIYPGSSLKTSWVSQGELREGISVLWESKDSPQAVSEYYKKKLPELGWIVGSSFESEGSYTISFEKETSDGFIGITQGEGGLSQISVTLGIEIISI
jgi:hypothetical protein